MSTYRVEFEEGRVGRTRGIAPVEFTARSPGDLVRAIEGFVRGHLMSKEVEVVAYSGGQGDCGDGAVIVGGFRTVAEFEWFEVKA